MSAPTTTDPDHRLTVAFTSELAPGTLLHDGRYRVVSILGRGGFGITYATEDRDRGQRVAVKELFPDPVVRDGLRVVAPAHAAAAFRASRERFLREAAVLARFTHPGIVRVHDVFEENSTAYLVMELLEGRTLADVLDARGGPLSEREALDVAARCGQALADVHRAGVLHRDLNPTNVMVTGDGRVVLIDFGLAQAFTAEHTGVMTRMVTPGYAPPEQYLGQARFGPPTDVYGLAATIYRVLAGRAPLSALDRQGGMALTPPRRFNPKVSRLVSDGVLDGLELQAGHRPQTMAAFLARLGLGAAIPAVTAADGDPPAEPAMNRQQICGGSVASSQMPAQMPAVPPPNVLPPRDKPGGRAANRWKTAVPTLAAVAAVGAAAPVLSAILLALVGLPALATAGDALHYVRAHRGGGQLLWRHRVALPAFVPMRYIRNLGAVLYVGMSALVLLSAVVAVTLLLDAAGAGSAAEEFAVRTGGATVALLLVIPTLGRRDRLRAAVAGDEIERRWLDGQGRLTREGGVLWVVAAFVTVMCLGFRPDLWPLG